MMRLEQSKPLSEAPVNGGRNYNGPKVAKFLVGQVPTCTNGVTMATLSSVATFQGICGCAARAFTKCVLSTQAPGLQPESGTGSPSL